MDPSLPNIHLQFGIYNKNESSRSFCGRDGGSNNKAGNKWFIEVVKSLFKKKDGDEPETENTTTEGPADEAEARCPNCACCK